MQFAEVTKAKINAFYAQDEIREERKIIMRLAFDFWDLLLMLELTTWPNIANCMMLGFTDNF